jgi:hypothetical protein
MAKRKAVATAAISPMKLMFMNIPLKIYRLSHKKLNFSNHSLG